MKGLPDEKFCDEEQLSDILGKPRGAITDIIALTCLPQKLRDECRGDHKVFRAILLEMTMLKALRAGVEREAIVGSPKAALNFPQK